MDSTGEAHRRDPVRVAARDLHAASVPRPPPSGHPRASAQPHAVAPGGLLSAGPSRMTPTRGPYHRTLTAAVIDSRDFLNAKRRAETEILLPPGPRIAFAGGVDYNDHARIWAALDQVREKHPAMVLMHGGSPKGAERIAACWADKRQVPQVAFKPDWARHKNAAPFKRNDQMLEAMPIGVLLFPGSGISENLADKARKMGIPVKRFVPKDGAA